MKRQDADIEAAFQAADRTTGRPGIQATITGAYFEGGCCACEAPERGGTLVLIEIGARTPHNKKIPLCPMHYNILRGVLDRLAPVRDI